MILKRCYNYTALQELVTKVNQNTNNINSLDGRVDALEQA